MKKLVKDVISGFEDAIAYSEGDKTRGIETLFTVPEVDVKAVRAEMNMTQEEFSNLFAIKIRTLQDWEQHRRRPTTPARILMAVIQQNPQSVKRTLKSLGYPFGKNTTKKLA